MNKENKVPKINIVSRLTFKRQRAAMKEAFDVWFAGGGETKMGKYGPKPEKPNQE